MSRLSSFELNRSVEDLLGAARKLAKPSQLPDDPPGYQSAPIAASFVANVHSLAHEVALRLSRDDASIAALSSCDVATQGEQLCGAQFLDHFLRRAYRRPATREDLTEMGDVFATGQKQGGSFASGVRAVIEVALQNPDFLYLIPQCDGAQAPKQ